MKTVQNHRFPETFPQTKNQLSRADSQSEEKTWKIDDSVPNPIRIEQFQRNVIAQVSKSRFGLAIIFCHSFKKKSGC